MRVTYSSISSFFTSFITLVVFIFHGSTALVCVGQLIAEVPISPSIVHTHSVGLLWKIDQPVPENSTWQHANTKKRLTSMALAEFEPSVPASERPKTHALDRAATGIGYY